MKKDLKNLMRVINKIIWTLVIVILMIGVLGTAQASMESITIQGGKETVRTIDVASGDTVFITFKTVGEQTFSTVDFWVIFPNSTNQDFGQVSQYTISFESQTDGKCEMHFDNSNSTESILVTLDYSIDRYYFGLPQWIFLLIVIGIFLLAIVMGYIIMGKYS